MTVSLVFARGISSLIRLLPMGLLPITSQQSLLLRLQQPHEIGKLHKNVVLNPTKGTSFTHIEFTAESVRLEFSSSRDPQYKALAYLKTCGGAVGEEEDLQRRKTGDVKEAEEGDEGDNITEDLETHASPLYNGDADSPDELIRDVFNLDFCGGGATVILNRQALAKTLQQNIARQNSQSLLDDTPPEASTIQDPVRMPSKALP